MIKYLYSTLFWWWFLLVSPNSVIDGQSFRIKVKIGHLFVWPESSLLIKLKCSVYVDISHDNFLIYARKRRFRLNLPVYPPGVPWGQLGRGLWRRAARQPWAAGAGGGVAGRCRGSPAARREDGDPEAARRRVRAASAAHESVAETRQLCTTDYDRLPRSHLHHYQ